MRYILALSLILFVSACAGVPSPPSVVVQTRLITPQIDTNLLSCGDAPVVPAHAVLQSDVARYLVSLWVWGNQCRSHLDAVRQSLSFNVKE